MNKEEMIEAKKLNPVDFLAKVLEPEKHTDHICWKCKGTGRVKDETQDF